jgi:hypothetical protein
MGFDYIPPHQRHSATSRASALKVDFNKNQTIVMQTIHEGGLTDLEGQEKSGMSGDSWRPARVFLWKNDFLENSGETRITSSGRQATIWKLTQKGREHKIEQN